MGNGAAVQGPADTHSGKGEPMGNTAGGCGPFAVDQETLNGAGAGRSPLGEFCAGGSRGRSPLPLRLPTPAEVEGPGVLDVDEATKIEFLTDVEGNWEYFMRWVSMSETLHWVGEDRGAWGPGELQLHDGCIFVFGGDAPDKGPGDIRFVRILLDLKARYRERVFILLGNRDVNKLRFSAELVPGVEPFELPWDKKALSLEAWSGSHPELPTGSEVTKLKWMLHFMGCQNTTFKTRQHELALLYPTERITETDVLESFRGCVDAAGDDPWMLRLIQAGKLAVVLGDSLFVHGGLHDAALGQVPGMEKVSGSLRDWATKLNGWKDSQVRDFLKAPYWVQWPNQEGRSRGAEELILYGTPGFPDNATVVYYNPFSDGNPTLLSEPVQSYLAKNGIMRVFSGHQPHGQSPTVVRHPASGLLRVTGDTSYSCPSADKLFNPANMRGSVVSMLRVQGKKLEINGVLADGRPHGCVLHRDSQDDTMPCMLVGRQLTDGSWVKTVIKSKDGEECTVQAVLGRGFSLKTEDMHFGKACLKLKREFAVEKLATPLSDLMPDMLKPSTPRSQQTFGPEEDPHGSRNNARLATMTLYSREDFLEAETFIFNVGGVVDKVVNMGSTKTITRYGTDLELENKIVKKINELIGMGKKVIFMSNNSNDSRKAAAEKLAKKGINIPATEFYKHVLNTSYTCAWFLKNAGISNPFILCSDVGILEELRAMGITKYVATVKDDGTPKQEYLEVASYANVCNLIQKAPDVDAVVVGWDRQLTTLKVDVATAYLNWGTRNDATGAANPELRQIPLIGCSSDIGGLLGTTPNDYLPERNFNDRQVRTVGNGSMARLVCDVAGTNSIFFDVGQPSELMLEALTRPVEEQGLGINPKTAVMIGDVLSTDIAMANHGGMRSLLVFSGETRREDFFSMDSKDSSSHIMPTWILNSFAET